MRTPSIQSIKDLGVAQLVARYLGVVEAVGSSPVTQTSPSIRTDTRAFYLAKCRYEHSYETGNFCWTCPFRFLFLLISLDFLSYYGILFYYTVIRVEMGSYGCAS